MKFIIYVYTLFSQNYIYKYIAHFTLLNKTIKKAKMDRKKESEWANNQRI